MLSFACWLRVGVVKVTRLLSKGAVLESELGTEIEIGCVEGMCGLKVV